MTTRPSRLPRSIAVRAVITFVSEAIGRRVLSARAASTRPLAASIATNDRASTLAVEVLWFAAGTAAPGTASASIAKATRAIQRPGIG